MSIINDRRIGRFTIPLEFINRDPDAVRVAMSSVIPLEARVRVWADDVEYTALSPHFAELPVGHAVPTYSAQLRKRDDDSVELTGWK